MAALIDHMRYNHLPSLQEAYDVYQARPIDKVINGPIRDVFIKHRTLHTFGLYLQHRHHQLDANEAVVKVGGTAHVMSDKKIQEFRAVGKKVVPTTWMTSNLEWTPMEYALVPSSAADMTIDVGFLADLLSVFIANGCTDLFGIDALAKDEWVEMDVNNASVAVSLDDDHLCPQEDLIPVALAFKEDEPTFYVHGKCKANHKHTTKPKPKRKLQPQS